jgi:NADPH-dependent 2,4-dienoyl-CoA reductase/sulfur reductase-like enzyme
MEQKILIIGGVAGGASSAARLRRMSEEDKIIMFERGPHVSFSNCSLPYHLSGIVKEVGDLVLMTPELFKKQYNIDARVNSEVIKINRQQKYIVVNTTIA